MSYSGQPLDPSVLQALQQYQQQQQKMAMAQSLMGNNATGPNAGIANVGGDILGALAAKRIQQQNSPENQTLQQRYGMSPSQAQNITDPSLMSRLGNFFGLGGSS